MCHRSMQSFGIAGVRISLGTSVMHFYSVFGRAALHGLGFADNGEVGVLIPSGSITEYLEAVW